jgi:4-hydroxybenzoate polyprenyltransferase
MMLLTAVCAGMAARRIDFVPAVTVVLAGIWLAAVAVAGRFAIRLAPAGGRRLEVMSGAWTLGLYLVLGIVPMAVKTWS